jgi:hypothetical protein
VYCTHTSFAIRAFPTPSQVVPTPFQGFVAVSNHPLPHVVTTHSDSPSRRAAFCFGFQPALAGVRNSKTNEIHDGKGQDKVDYILVNGVPMPRKAAEAHRAAAAAAVASGRTPPKPPSSPRRAKAAESPKQVGRVVGRGARDAAARDGDSRSVRPRGTTS